MDAVETAFVDGTVVLFMADGQEADQDAISAALKANKITVKGFKKPDAMPF